MTFTRTWNCDAPSVCGEVDLISIDLLKARQHVNDEDEINKTEYQHHFRNDADPKPKHEDRRHRGAWNAINGLHVRHQNLAQPRGETEQDSECYSAERPRRETYRDFDRRDPGVLHERSVQAIVHEPDHDRAGRAEPTRPENPAASADFPNQQKAQHKPT